MNDVAELAGVGRGTVSNYINGQRIKDKNKKKIESAIRQLHYVPNLQARELKTAHNSAVIFIVPTNWTPFFSELVFKMQEELDKHGYKMILANSHSSPKEEKEILRKAILNQVLGVITMSYSDVYNVMNFQQSSNLVSIERYVSPEVPLVTSDNYAGGRLAAEKLIEMHKDKILLLRRAVNHYNATDIRTKAFIECMKQNNISVDVFEASIAPSYRQEYFNYLKTHFQKKRIFYNGIFTVTDEYGKIAKEALQIIDPAILKQVEIIGFDGARADQDEPLTIDTIRQPVDEIVKSSVTILMDMIDGKTIEKNWKKVLPVSFLQKEKLFN